MKRLQLHKLIAACLGSVILLCLFSVRFDRADVTLPAPAPFSQDQPDTMPRSSGSIGHNPAAGSPFELPATANQGMASLSDELMAQSQSIVDETLTDLHNFVVRVTDNQKNEIRGVYVPRLFAFPVTQQPQNNPIFVSNKHDRVTLFQNASRNNVTGLLAHNYLAGSYFQQLAPGHQVLVVYGDGSIRRYKVTSIHHFQKLEPANVRSPLIDLSTGKTLTTAEVYSRFYRGEHHVTLQTCLERYGRLDWGLTFIVAFPIEN